MLKIDDYCFISGDMISCYIKGVEIKDAKIYVDEQENRYFICHNFARFDGSESPVKFEYQYSWGFSRYGNEFSSDVSNIRPFIKSIDRKKCNFSEDMSMFIKIHQLESILLLFNYKYGIFDEYESYDLSENKGFITLINERKKMEIKLGRLIKKLVLKFNEVASKTPGIRKLDITDKVIESIYNKYVSFQQKGKQLIEFLEGPEILKGYTRYNYFDESGGTIHNSCMSDLHSYLSIYTENPNRVKLAVIYMNNKIAARCIVWTATDGKQYSDRIYYRYDWMENFMKETLRKMEINPVKEQGLKIVQLEKWNFNEYPYLDSFYNFDVESGTLVCIGQKSRHMRSTNGTITSNSYSL
jgi:hypothetical protein